MQRELRRRQQARVDRTRHAHIEANKAARLGLEQRAVTAPVDKKRTHQRHYERQNDRNRQSKQSSLQSQLRRRNLRRREPQPAANLGHIGELWRRIYVAATQLRVTIFPGFIMFCGSSARLIEAMASSAAVPCSATRYFILPCPTPCSPVQVPSIESARSTSRSDSALARLTSSSSSMSISSVRWKFPSPTWPTMGAMIRLCSMSRCVSVPHSASRDIGTQTSVATMAAPGRSAKFDSAAWWRASHKRVRSSGRVVHVNGPPPNSAAISPNRLDCSATDASVP